jgi:uncharacterized repeat protein (TIGR03987 family)
MSSFLIVSVVLITTALIFYSIGVWAERFTRYLKPWHVVSFWIGFTFDVSGTWSMHLMARGSFDLSEPHTLTGQIALWLMFLHAAWATYVVRKGSVRMLTQFHRYSTFVWMVWLIPYFGGMFLGIKS